MVKVAIASGKGGTGKTLISTNLFSILEDYSLYIDCDVEEPNGHLFLKPQNIQSTDVNVLVPEVDESKCTHCGRCGEVCQYHAIISAKKKTLVFPELCHSCGNCVNFCSQKAISEKPRQIGVIEKGLYGTNTVLTGKLNIGEPMAPPVISQLKSSIKNDSITIIDSPPGTSCPVIEAIRNCDYVILVTEPTPFGLHDLGLAIEVVRKLRIPFGVVINKAGIGKEFVEEYCLNQGIKILLKIFHDIDIAKKYSEGELLTTSDHYKKIFIKLYADIRAEMSEVIE
jgi:MinD superfamily P-loop ATPase